MNIYPAIDIYNGKGVRLKKGKFNDVTVYGSPLALCQRWVDAGTTKLHVVDLNGARQEGNNLQVIVELVNTFPIDIQVGGGIRTLDQARLLLDSGVRQVILGTSAIKNKEMTQMLIDCYPNRVIIGVDAKKGKVAVEGWEEMSLIDAVDFIEELVEMGVKKIIYTDISRDGMLAGPNFEAYENILKKVNVDLVASGGVTTVDDLRKLKAIGVEGAILGKTLYENIITFEEALLC